MNKTEQVSAADWAEISNLYAFYNLCSDGGDAAGYASCFTEDGVMDQVTRKMQIRGRQHLAEYKNKDVAGRGGMYRRHWNSGLCLRTRSPGVVLGVCYLHAYNGVPGSLPQLQAAGVYEDTIVLVDGQWKFAYRKLTMDARTDTPVPSQAVGA